MHDNNSLAHTSWNCKYHIVFAPKNRRKIFYGENRAEIGKILRELCDWKGVHIISKRSNTLTTYFRFGEYVSPVALLFSKYGSTARYPSPYSSKQQSIIRYVMGVFGFGKDMVQSERNRT